MGASRLFLHRRLRPVAGVGHRAVVASELAVERALDALASPQVRHPLVHELTALVKTFERPRVLRRLLDSIRRLYPELHVIVADDSRDPQRFTGVETVAMPFASGLAAGRSEALRRARTPFVLVLDDDFVFYRHTRLAPALAAMDEHPEIDIMGGQVVTLPVYRRSPRSLEEWLYPTAATPRIPIGTAVGGFAVAAKVPNFFIARRDRLALVDWDRRVRMLDHADFFTRALGVLTTVYNPKFRCLHARTPYARQYMEARLDFAADGPYLAEKHGLGD